MISLVYKQQHLCISAIKTFKSVPQKELWYWLINWLVALCSRLSISGSNCISNIRFSKGSSITWTNAVCVHELEWLEATFYFPSCFQCIQWQYPSYTVYTSQLALNRDPTLCQSMSSLSFEWCSFIQADLEFTDASSSLVFLSHPWETTFQADKRTYCDSAHKVVFEGFFFSCTILSLLCTHHWLLKQPFYSRTHSN